MGIKQTISAHVMALFYQHHATRLDMKHPEDSVLMDRWIMRVNNCPDNPELIMKCFEPLYEMKKMPGPEDFLKQLANHRKIKPEKRLTMKEFKAAANTPWRKALLNFLTTPGQFTGGARVYYLWLAELAKQHNRMDFHDECIGHSNNHQPQEAR